MRKQAHIPRILALLCNLVKRCCTQSLHKVTAGATFCFCPLLYQRQHISSAMLSAAHDKPWHHNAETQHFRGCNNNSQRAEAVIAEHTSCEATCR